MSERIYVQFIDVTSGARASICGPFEHVTLTYDMLRAGDLGNHDLGEIASWDAKNEVWIHDGRPYSDIIMHTDEGE
jgi:hypothetical protein